MKFLLSIIIPTYNREKLLNRCLESLDFSQKNVEIIVVDDGSKFKVKDKFKNYKKKIKFYRIGNSGRTYALFYGIKKANSHYIMVLDDDDYFIKNGLKIIVNILKQNQTKIINNVDLFAFGTLIKKGKTLIKSIPPKKKLNLIELKADYKLNTDIKEIPKTKIIKKVINKIKLKKFERVPTGLLWANLSGKCQCINRAVVYKEYYEDGITSNISYSKFKDSNYMINLYEIYSKSNDYSSIFFRFCSNINMNRYCFHAKKDNKISLYYLLGFLIFLYDKLFITINEKKNKNYIYN